MFEILSVYMNPTGIYCMAGAENRYRLYKNPDARDLFIKAQNAKTIQERANLFKQMGEYDILDKTPHLSYVQKIKTFIKGIIK